MDGRTDMTKLTAAFRNFAKAPRNLNTSVRCSQAYIHICRHLCVTYLGDSSLASDISYSNNYEDNIKQDETCGACYIFWRNKILVQTPTENEDLGVIGRIMLKEIKKID